MARLGIDSIKRFFSLHVEKIVLGGVVALLIFFVIRGYSLDGLANDSRPDVLAAKASEVKTFIETKDKDETIVKKNEPTTGFVGRTKSGLASIGGGYLTNAGGIITPPSRPPGAPRLDPELFAPMDIEAVAKPYLGIAYIPVRGEVDQWADDMNMEPKKAEVAKKKKKKRSSRGNDMGSSGAGLPGMRSGFGAIGEGDEENEDEGLEGMEGMRSGGGIGGPEVGAGIVTMASSADIEGFRPPLGAIVITRHIVGVMARIPIKKQWDAFVDTFSNAMDYDRVRDTPTYLGFYAERCEVTDEADTDFKWKAISTSDFVLRQLNDPRRIRPNGGWAGYPQEIADPRYVLPGILTMPIPPVVFRSFDDIALHSMIPRFQIQKQGSETGDEVEATAEEGEPMDISADPSLSGVGGAQPGLGEGMQGMGRAGMGGGGLPGMGAGVPAMGGGRAGMMGSGAQMGGYGSGGGGRMGMGGMDGEGYEEGGSYGGMGMGGMMGETPTIGPSVDYLMVRFFDLSIKDTTKKYRYRIQLWVEDPNHPKDSRSEPNLRALHPKLVRARIAEIKAKEVTAKKRLSYFRRTEFSEPSGLVSFELSSKTLGGEISKDKSKVIDDPFGNPFELVLAERSAKVMSVVWDAKRAIDVPGLVNAQRGTFLNFNLNADVVHPVTLQYKTLENYTFKTNRLVMDFMGGQPLPVPKEEEEDNPLFAPAEFLFMNEYNELFVKNELDDWVGFQRHTPPVQAGESMFGGDAMGDGLEGMEGYGDEEGDEGGRGGRRGGGDDE